MSVKIFYYNNHKRDINGRIIERDYRSYQAVECSLCHGPIKGEPSFSKHGKSNIVYGLVGGLRSKNRIGPIMDLGNVDYCEDCHIKLAGSNIRLINNFKKAK